MKVMPLKSALQALNLIPDKFLGGEMKWYMNWRGHKTAPTNHRMGSLIRKAYVHWQVEEQKLRLQADTVERGKNQSIGDLVQSTLSSYVQRCPKCGEPNEAKA